MSTCCHSIRSLKGAKLAKLPLVRLSMTRTPYPWRTNPWGTFEPMNPAPPVIATISGIGYGRSGVGLIGMRCDSSRAVLQNNAATVNLNIYSNYCFFARKSADAQMTGWSTVYPYFQAWKNAGVWTCIQRSMYQQARRQAGRAACPSVVIMDGQSVKTTERGGIWGFEAHKRVKGRKRHILVDTFGLLIACRVEPADISDRNAAARLLGGLRPLFPNIRTVIADAGHQSRKLAAHLWPQEGWKLQIVKRRQRAFKITGLTWIVERSF